MLDETAQFIDGVETAPVPTPQPAAGHQRWRLTDRLGEAIIQQLLADSRAGATKQSLTEQYGISRSSVKRILKKDQSQALA